MSSELKLRRGTNAAHASFIGAQGEVTYNTDTKALHAHDNSTPGGFPGGGFLQAGTGAAVRSAQAKMRDIVSVKDFGAVGDGVTNDTAALQAAIATGKDLYWPSGEYLISGTLTGVGAWYGDGQGNSYSSTYSGSGTFIRLSGSNGGAAFLKPPLDFEGFHIDGVNKAGIAIDLGQNGSFTGFQRWKKITIRRCADAIRGFNFFSTSFEDSVIQGNTRGITITPTDGAGDDGYFTATNWDNVHIADNDVYGLNVNVPLGTRTWVCRNVVIERNGLTGGTYQAYLQNVTINGYGMYFEDSPSIPGLRTNNSNVLGSDWYFNGTGGIDGTSNALTLSVNRLLMTSATDVLVNIPATARLTLKDSAIQTDIRASAGFIAMENTTIQGVADRQNFRPKTIAIGQAPGTLYQPTELRFSYAGKRVFSGTINANASAMVVADQYFEGIMGDGCGFGSVAGYYPGLLVEITPAQTGNTNYYCVRLVNTTASNITLSSVQINWIIFRALSVTV